MKNRFMTAVFVIATLTYGSVAFAHGNHSMDSKNESQPHYHDIHAKELKALIDSGQAITILDARTPEYDDKSRLPHAQFIPYDSPEKEIYSKIPSKESIIVVYCTSLHCPASKYLADRLVKMGYTNVYKYSEGIQDWKDKGYPIEKAS